MKSSFDRREFLKYQLNGFLWLTAGSLFQSKVFAAVVPDISVVKGKPAPAVRSAIELLGGMSRFVKKGNKVVIKPNMSFPVTPERASNTHPEVVRTIAEMCKEAGASRMLILDNPLAPEDICLKKSGILDACKSVDDKMVHMVSKSSSFKKTSITNAESLTSTDIMKDVLSADVLIAAPVAKSHSGAGVSLSMKGMMGLIYDRRIMHRLDLHNSIVDLASILKPHLVVVDATRVLSTGGPRGPGKVLKKDTIIASSDMVAADAYTVSAFEWYGATYRPDQIAHIRYAHKRGLGRMDIKNLNIKKIEI